MGRSYRYSKRVIDILLAASLMVVFLPLMLFLMPVFYFSTGRVFDSQVIHSWRGGVFKIYRFATATSAKAASDENRIAAFAAKYSLDRLPAMLSVLTGELSFVGPEVVSAQMPEPIYVRESVLPGLTGLYQLRRSANIAHETQLEAEQEYLATRSLKTDLGILLRSFLMLFLGKKASAGESPPHINLLDIETDNQTMSEAVDWIVEHSRDNNASQVAFVNPDCFNIATVNHAYKAVLQQCSKVFADGIGIHYATKMLNLSMNDNVNGTDLFPYLCQAMSREKLSLYLLGGRPEVIMSMVGKLRMQYPELKLAGYQHGYFSALEEPGVVDSIRQSGANVLLVAFGAPRQEMWINQNLQQLHVGVAIGVGGLFDFVSGRIPRAPRWMREIGLEWLYRLLQEPRRMWRRYIIGNPLFLWRVWRWKRSNSQH